MTQLADDTTTLHLAHLDRASDDVRGGPGPGGEGPLPWVAELRRRAAARFREVGFPTTRDEEWRHTSVLPIARTRFEPGHLVESGPAEHAARLHTFARDAVAELVFVNGHFSPQLSHLGRLPKGLTVSTLSEAARSGHAEVVERHLARHASIEANPFVALNTAYLRDGAFVHVARGTAVTQPVHLLFISTPASTPTVSHPRVLVVAEENGQCAVVESFAGAPDVPGAYLTNSVTELVLGPGAVVDYDKLQQESTQAYHVATSQAHLDRAADLISHSTTLGGRLTRNDLTVTLDGEGAHATLNGLVIIGSDQHCDNHTLLRHEKPNCPSHELYKHVLDGNAVGVFKGKIFVQKDAQKTDAKQTSKSLILSDEAAMNAMPALEIYADDVKCTHGSTTGPVDEDMVFYLRSRGVGLDAARHLLTYAFAADITRRIRVEPVRRRIEDYMAAQHGLPLDLRITDLGSHDEAAL